MMRKRVILLLFFVLTGIIIYLNASLFGLLQAISLPVSSELSHTRRTELVHSTISPAAGKVLRLALIYQSDNEHFWNLVEEGARAAANGQTVTALLPGATGSIGDGASRGPGVYLRVFDSRSGGQFQVEDNLRLAMLARYDGIIMHAEDESIVPLIREAGNEGIPVVVVASDLPGSGRISYVGTNNYRAGFAAGKAMLRAVAATREGAGVAQGTSNQVLPFESGVSRGMQFAILSAVSGKDRQLSTAESLKVFGFREAVSSVEGSDILVWQKCEPTLLDSVASIRRLLDEHPEVDGIYATHAPGTIASARVIVEKNLVGKVNIVGFGDVPEIIDFIRQGAVAASIVEYPYQMGFTAVRELLLYLREGRVNVFNNMDGLILTRDNLQDYR